MADLKLLALDEEDLLVISSMMQDAVMKMSDLDYDRKSGHFLCATNRFAWEKKRSFFARNHERRRTYLVFKQVTHAQFRGIDPKKQDHVMSLLAINFKPIDQGPEGQIEFVLSGQGAILLDVECIEVQMTDMGAAWGTRSRPKHGI